MQNQAKSTSNQKSKNLFTNLSKSQKMKKKFIVLAIFSDKNNTIVDSFQFYSTTYSDAKKIASIAGAATKHHDQKHNLTTNVIIIDRESKSYTEYGRNAKKVFTPFPNMKCTSTQPLNALDSLHYICQLNQAAFIDLVRVEFPQATRLEDLFRTMSSFLNDIGQKGIVNIPFLRSNLSLLSLTRANIS